MDDDIDCGPWNHHVRQRDNKHARRKPKDRSGPARSTKDTPTVGGIVSGVTRDVAEVWLPDGALLTCRVPPAMRARDRARPAVGDDAVVALGEIPTLLRLGPRRTSLSRRDPHNPHRQRVVVANVDWVGIVGAASDPPLRPKLVDRYLMAVHHGGAVPIVVVNKIDEAAEEDRAWVDEVVSPWERAGLAVVRVSAATGEGLTDLIGAMGEGRGAFVGHSGVGKSSLVAALGGEAAAAGLAVHGRGRHTTTHSTLHHLPCGARVIDTPGVRQFAPWSPTMGDLHATFADVVELGKGCGWSGCTHIHEDDCAVLGAIERGEFPEHRRVSWMRLVEEVDGLG